MTEPASTTAALRSPGPAGYEGLRAILDEALAHAAEGKGRERHANGNPFEQQPILTTTRVTGAGFPLGQAMKKTGEAAGMLRRDQDAAAIAELLGAINYLAAAVIYVREVTPPGKSISEQQAALAKRPAIRCWGLGAGNGLPFD